MEHQQAEKCLKKKSQKLNLPGYVNKCVQSWYKSNDNILSRTFNTKRKERLINWEKLKDVHFTSTSRLSILIALNEEANLRPAKEVCFFFFFFFLSTDDFTTLERLGILCPKENKKELTEKKQYD